MQHRAIFGMIAALALMASGCATKEYVRSETGSVHTRVDSVEKQVEQNQTAIHQTNERVGQTEKRIGETEEHVTKVSKTAQEALERAEAAGKLAQGKLLYETVLTDSDVHFAFDKAELSDEAKAALDKFAEDLKSQLHQRLHRDPGPHRFRRFRRLQREAGPRAGRERTPLPQPRTAAPAPPYVGDLLWRDRTDRGQRHPRGPLPEPARGAGRAPVAPARPARRPETPPAAGEGPSDPRRQPVCPSATPRILSSRGRISIRKIRKQVSLRGYSCPIILNIGPVSFPQKKRRLCSNLWK